MLQSVPPSVRTSLLGTSKLITFATIGQLPLRPALACASCLSGARLTRLRHPSNNKQLFETGSPSRRKLKDCTEVIGSAGNRRTVEIASLVKSYSGEGTCRPGAASKVHNRIQRPHTIGGC